MNGGRGEPTDTFGGGSSGSPNAFRGGGGGGYSGGNGDNLNYGSGGGGGGSFNVGFNQVNVPGVGTGHGSVTIIVYTVVGSNCQPGCLDEGACNYDPLAAEEDGSCEYGTCAGCDDEGACNYDATVTISDPEACEYFTCLGCLDEEACNYDETATLDAQDCIYAGEVRDCDDNCYNDADGDGVCDEEEVFGCTYPQADNFNPLATEEDGTCTFDGATQHVRLRVRNGMQLQPSGHGGRRVVRLCRGGLRLRRSVFVRFGQRRHLQPVRRLHEHTRVQLRPTGP